MKTLRLVAPWALLIFSGLIDWSHSRPIPDLGDSAVESIVRDVKDNDRFSESKTVSADSHGGHEVDLSPKITSIDDENVGTQYVEPTRNNGFGTEHVDLSTQKAEGVSDPSKATSTPMSSSSMRTPLYDTPIPSHAVDDQDKFLEGAEKSIVPWKDSSKTNPMISEESTPASNELVKPATGVRRRIRKNPSQMKEAYLKEIEDDPPHEVEDDPPHEVDDDPPHEVEDETVDRLPITTVLKRLFIYYLLIFQSLSGDFTARKLIP
ncbi:hypothetical protein DFH28DRAFT_978057 [Melampsora americana]|nr:hypothetical protein DFH28DRAFT_978057 [Melampsora americana]